MRELVGLLFPVSLTYVKENPVPNPSFLCGSFIVEANASILTALDSKLSLPVGNDCTCKKNDGNTVKDRIETCVKQPQICLLTATETCMNMITSSGDFCSSYCEGTKLSCAWSFTSVIMSFCCNIKSICFPLRLHFQQQCLPELPKKWSGIC